MTMNRLQFAFQCAWRHLLISALMAAAAAAVVFGWWYPMPYRTMLGVSSLFMLVLAVDVVCGPLMTAILASPKKSRRERWVDFVLVGLIQIAALAYGLHSVWLARPVVLAFERDRLVVVTANEVQTEQLAQAPEGLRQLPWGGVVRVGTREAASNDEFLQSLEQGLAGVSPAMRPGWWQPWGPQVTAALQKQAKPLNELIARRPEQADTLRMAVKNTGLDAAHLYYIPLTSSKTSDWVALLDADMNMVGHAPVDGF